MAHTRKDSSPEPVYPDYVFSNADHEAPNRFSALSALYDPQTVRYLDSRGVEEGWNCLEVGGGGGSIGRWLAKRVGPAGHVLVTDIDPRFLESLDEPNLEVRQHNIATDPLPEAFFDLIHARLVLIHIPERERVLGRLVAALKPGGWLVEEEFDSASLPPDPTSNPAETYLETHRAVMRLLDARGVERHWGRLLFGQLVALGLWEVQAEGRMFMGQGGTPGAALTKANFLQSREDLIQGGYITQTQFDLDLARLDDQAYTAPSPIMWTAWGRRNR